MCLPIAKADEFPLGTQYNPTFHKEDFSLLDACVASDSLLVEKFSLQGPVEETPGMENIFRHSQTPVLPRVGQGMFSGCLYMKGSQDPA